MNPIEERRTMLTRRHFFSVASTGLGAAALVFAAAQRTPGRSKRCPHFAPKAKRVIYLFQHGGPSQMDLFDL